MTRHHTQTVTVRIITQSIGPPLQHVPPECEAAPRHTAQREVHRGYRAHLDIAWVARPFPVLRCDDP